MKRKIPIILTLIYIYIYPQNAQAHNYKAFETWGDVWQVLPFVMMGYKTMRTNISAFTLIVPKMAA